MPLLNGCRCRQFKISKLEDFNIQFADNKKQNYQPTSINYFGYGNDNLTKKMHPSIMDDETKICYIVPLKY